MNSISGVLVCTLSLIFLSLAGAAVNPCYNVPDGTIKEHLGCYKAIVCLKGIATQVNCTNGTVFDKESKSCKPIGTGKTACGQKVGSCEGRKDGMYGDEGCMTYYWCMGGKLLEHTRNYCPANLLFDGRSCNFPYNIPPPCGYMEVTPEPSTEAPEQYPTTEAPAYPTTPAAENITPAPVYPKTTAAPVYDTASTTAAPEYDTTPAAYDTTPTPAVDPVYETTPGSEIATEYPPVPPVVEDTTAVYPATEPPAVYPTTAAPARTTYPETRPPVVYTTTAKPRVTTTVYSRP